MTHNQNTHGPRRMINLHITVITGTFTQPCLQQLINQVQVFTQVVLVTWEKNQTLSPKQVLAHVITRLTPAPLPPATPSSNR
jgi:hypothetical protein